MKDKKLLVFWKTLFDKMKNVRMSSWFLSIGFFILFIAFITTNLMGFGILQPRIIVILWWFLGIILNLIGAFIRIDGH